MRSRAVQVFVVIVLVGGLASGVAPAIGLSLYAFWVGLFVTALVVAVGVASKSAAGSSFFPTSGGFLCDDCKYNDARYCSRPERPHARRCPDHKSR